MKRAGRGLHPVILSIISGCLAAALSLTWFGVWCAERQAAAEATRAARPHASARADDSENETLPESNRPTGLLMDPAIRLIYFREAEQALRAPIGAAFLVFLGSLVWCRQPRTG